MIDEATKHNNLSLAEIAEQLHTAHAALEGLAELLCVASASRQGSEFEGVGNLACLIAREQAPWINRLMELAYSKIEDVSSEQN